jgi:hypothetical protein
MTTEKENDEFRGLFLGEGYCSIIKYQRNIKWENKNGTVKKHYWFYMPKMSLLQRADNKEMVNWIKEKYGGQVWIARGTSGKHNPAFTWSTHNIELTLKLCNILLNGLIPSKKLKSIEIVKKYCEWKLNRGLQTKMTEEDYSLIDGWYKQCQENHSYKL